MGISENENELITRYLDKNLTNEDQDELARLLESSESFRNELADQQALIAGIKAHRKAGLKKEFKEAFARMDAGKQKTRMSRLRKLRPQVYWLGAAAAVLLILFLVFPGQYHDDELSAGQLYKNYYAPISLNNVSRGEVNLDNGLTLYQNGDYEKAIPYLKELRKGGAYKLAPVYLGVSYIETGLDEEAMKVFRKLLNENPDPYQRQHANWYLALLHLKKGNVPEARQKLNKLTANGSIYQKEAEELLNMTRPVSRKD